MREEWIEIAVIHAALRRDSSPPVREEWIEIIGLCSFRYMSSPSPPVREEWIEISYATPAAQREKGLLPCGRSGLKLPGLGRP